MSNSPFLKFELPVRLAKGEQRLSTATFALNATRAGLWAEFGAKTDKQHDPVMPVLALDNSTQAEIQHSYGTITDAAHNMAIVPEASHEAVQVVRLLDEKDQAEADHQAYIAQLLEAAKGIHDEPTA